MKKAITIFFFTMRYALIVFIFSQKTSAQNDGAPIGARAVGIGNSTVTISDQWAIFNNAAGMANIENIAVGVFFENRFGMKEFSSVAAGFVFPVNQLFRSDTLSSYTATATATSSYGVAGMSFYRFGDQLYNEQRAGIGYAHNIKNISLGIKVNYWQLSIEGLGTKRTYTIEFGGQAAITKELIFGAHIYNINQAKLAEYKDERVPTIMKAGLSYRPRVLVDKLMLNIETEKDVDFPVSFKAGVEYMIIEKLSLRTGISTRPFFNYFGVGFQFKSFDVNYALSTHSDLGLSHYLSVSYNFENIKNKE